MSGVPDSPADPTSSERFVFVDALRGIAATGVMLCHLLMASPLLERFGRFGPNVVGIGARGVQIFFVISGFVIAHSLRATPLTGREAGRFILRRQARLDPPYWVMLLIAMAVWRLHNRIHGTHALPVTWGDFVVNAAYLQRILQRPDLLHVGWTLCIEIQFYLAFIVLLRLGTRTGETNAAGPSRAVVAMVFLTALAALPLDPNLTHMARWAGPAWPYFAAGALCYWAVRRQAPVWPLAVLSAGMIAAGVWIGDKDQSPAFAGVVTVGAIYLVGRARRLGTLWGNRPVQYLGRISYSIYLTHIPITVNLLHVGERFVGRRQMTSVCCLVATSVAGIGVAHAYYLAVERPSMRLAKRMKSRTPVAVMA